MRPHRFRFTFLLLICLLIPLTVSAEPVAIPDPNLRAAIETSLNKQAGAPITAADMATLPHIVASFASISNLTGLEYATNLTDLHLSYNHISDLSAVSGLTNLTWLALESNNISDLSAVSGLTNLTWLSLEGNSISDLSSVSGLTNLTYLNLWGNPLSYPSITTHILALQSRGVQVTFASRTPTTLLKISGTITESNNLLVVEVRDGARQPFAGVPVTFTVTGSGGTLGATSTMTNENGRAESQLTLGADGKPNMVSASVEGISETVTFTDISTPLETMVIVVTGHIINADGTLAEAGLEVTATIGNNTETSVSERQGLYVITFLSLGAVVATSGDTVEVQVVRETTGESTRQTIQLSFEQIINQIVTINVQFPGQTVAIPDSNLRTVLETVLNKQADEPISTADMVTLTQLDAKNGNIADLTGLAHATNLTQLNLGGEWVANSFQNSNSVSDLSPLAGLINLTYLNLGGNSILDLSSVSGLTNLTYLNLGFNSITDLSPISGLTNLTAVGFLGNHISDLSSVSGLTNLTYLNLWVNPLNYPSITVAISALQSRGVRVTFANRTPTTLLKISGTITESDNVLVVEVRDGARQPFAGVPVTFTVTGGSGTLSTTSTMTNENGRAESQLTLGANGEPNTVSASVEGISETVTFTDISTPLGTRVIVIYHGSHHKCRWNAR